MYTKYWNRETIEGVENLENYKLCYIDEIPQTYSDYTPETKKFMETEEYKKLRAERDEIIQEELRTKGSYRFVYDELSRRIEFGEYPNPEYDEDKYTYFAYFTPRSLKDQWGDDWNDAPYEHNAGTPYDDQRDTEADIIVIPFLKTHDFCLPEEHFLNSPYSVKDINNGAVAWLYSCEKGISIQAGINPIEFINLMWK